MTSSLVTKTSKKKLVSLERILCICYPLRFRKDIADIRALIDSNSELNAMTPAYASKLDLKVHHTIIEA